MSDIKFISYDSSEVDSVAFDNKINTICHQSYRLDAGHLFVSYANTPKELYENLRPIIEEKNVLIMDVENSGYYGYHNSSLWKWLRENFEEEAKE